MSYAHGNGKRGKSAGFRPRLELLEDRIALAFDVVYVDDDFAGLVSGQVIPDADPMQPGDQPAIFGVDAFATVQQGVDAVTEGCSVLVNQGTYTENVAISKGLTLDGNAPLRSDVIVDAGGNGNGISVTADGVTIRDLRVTNGSDGIAGIDIDGLMTVNVQVDNCTNGLSLSNAMFFSDTGSSFLQNAADGVHLSNVSEVALIDFDASGNGDNGIEIRTSEDVKLTNGMTCDNGADGIRVKFGGSVTVIGVTSMGNTGSGSSDGLEATDIASLSVRDGSYSLNEDDGIFVSRVAGKVDVINIMASNNTNINSGGGLNFDRVGGQITINGGEFSMNANDGIQLSDVEGAVCNDLRVENNLRGFGVDIVTANYFVDSRSTYRDNADGGLFAHQISIGILLESVLAENNDRDHDGWGAGVQASNIGRIDIDSGMFRSTGGPNDHQSAGIFATGIQGVAAIADAIITGNEHDGLAIVGNGSQFNSAGVRGGAYSNNGENGMRILLFADVQIENCTANNNGTRGLVASSISGQVDLFDPTLQGNATEGGRIVGSPSTFAILNFRGSAEPDTVTVRGDRFEYTRGADAQQTISYGNVHLLSFTGLDGDDTFVVRRINSAVRTFLHGSGGADTFFIGSTPEDNNGNLDRITGFVTVTGSAPFLGGSVDCRRPLSGGEVPLPANRDVVYINDRANPNANNYVVDSTSVRSDPSRPFPAVFFENSVEYVRLDATDAPNIISVRPSSDTQFYIDGNLPGPGSPNGDVLKRDTTGTTGARISIEEPGKGHWTFTSGERDVCFESIERFNYTAILAVSRTGPLGRAVIDVFDAETLQPRATVTLYTASFRDGVRVATGDLNGDGFPDLVTAPGYGGAGPIRIFDGSPNAAGVIEFAELNHFDPYFAGFSKGINLAIGDVNGDGFADLITAPSREASPEVRVFDGTTLLEPVPTLLTGAGFMAFGKQFRGGVTVAAGDIDGDGFAEIVTGAGRKSVAVVKVWEMTRAGDNFQRLERFVAFPPDFTGGVFVAVGDYTGDGQRDIIVSANGDFEPQVRIFATDPGDNVIFAGDPIIAGSATVYPGLRTGVRIVVKPVAGGDPAGVEPVDIFTGFGRLSPSNHIRRIAHNDPTDIVDALFVEMGFENGVFLG